MANKLSNEDCLKMLNEAGLYTIEQLQTSGKASVHWDNITNKEALVNSFVSLSDTPSSITANYKLVGNAGGTALTFVEDTSTTDGREIELQNTGTYIQWRYVDVPETSWTNLITIADITGDKGDQGDAGDQGDTGDTGNGIVGVVRTSGDGSAGTVDTYTITYTDESTDTFEVTNGADGTDGTSVSVVSVIPLNSEGVDGDSIILLPTFDLYEKDTTWSKVGNISGDAGEDGEDGDVWSHGTVVPTDATLNSFDEYYLLTTNKNVYYKAKNTTSWSYLTNIQGDTYRTTSSNTIDLSSLSIEDSLTIELADDFLDYTVGQYYSIVNSSTDKLTAIVTAYSDSSIDSASFTGTGIDDLSTGGSFSDDVDTNYVVEIDETALSTAITLANSMKTIYNAHCADETDHTTGADTDNTISSTDATDLASLITLITELLTDYTAHEGDAELEEAWSYHAAQEGLDYSLDSVVAPTTVAECITRINDLKEKYNAHDTDTLAHGVGSQHQISTTTAYTADTFKWSDDDGSTWEATGVSITGTAQLLNNGVTITFTDLVGHTLADYWEFTANATSITGTITSITGTSSESSWTVNLSGIVESDLNPDWYTITATAGTGSVASREFTAPDNWTVDVATSVTNSDLPAATVYDLRIKHDTGLYAVESIVYVTEGTYNTKATGTRAYGSMYEDQSHNVIQLSSFCTEQAALIIHIKLK